MARGNLLPNYTIEQILSIDLESMNILKNNKQAVEDFRKKVMRGSVISQQRVQRVTKALESRPENYPTPNAYRKDGIARRILTAKEIKTLEYSQLVEQYTYIRKFLQMETSVLGKSKKQELKGWDKILNNFAETVVSKVKNLYGIDVDIRKEDYKFFWEIYNTIDTNLAAKGQKETNYEVYRDVAIALTNHDNIKDLLSGVRTVEDLATIIKNNMTSGEIARVMQETEDMDDEERALIENVFGKN